MTDYSANFEHLSPVWTHYTDIIVDHAEGSYIYATDGRKILDFACGIGVTNTGHCHPKVVEAIRQQAGLLLHGQANLVTHKPMLELVEELRTVVPPSLDGFFFSNSGAEALEGALKLARHATGKPNVIVFQGSFHGRTVATMSMTTSKTIYKQRIPTTDAGGLSLRLIPMQSNMAGVRNRRANGAWRNWSLLLQSQTAPSETAAIFIEPVLGEGGYVVPPDSFMQGLRKLMRSDMPFFLLPMKFNQDLDEPGNGSGMSISNIVPDIMTIAKGLASGMPISGVVSRLDLMKKWIPGSHGGTYGGNAVAAAAGVATIRAIKEDQHDRKCSRTRCPIESRTGQLREKYPQIVDVRGLGLMVGTEFRDSKGKPDKTTTKAIQHECLDRDLMILTAGTWDNTIRWIPPLNVTAGQINDALEIFASSMSAVLD